MTTSLPTTRATWWLLGLIAAFVSLGMLFCVYLASWDAEWSYLTLGALALQGHIGLFQDEIGGERLPLPFYVIGLSQLVGGPSLLAGRLTSLGLGVLALLGTFIAARSIAGNAAGLLAAAFLATHAVVVGYYAAASYFGWCAALVAAGTAALAGLPRPAGSLACMACFTAIAFSRANLAVMAPAVLVYLLVTATGWRERVSLLAVCGVPPAVFFLWSPEHLKILAYVPGLSGLVAPLGYRPGFAFGIGEIFVGRTAVENLAWFLKRHAAWIGATLVLIGGALLGRALGRRHPWPRLLVPIAALAVYTMVWQALILRMYLKSVAAWATAFAPLWAIVLGAGLTSMLERSSGRDPVRIATAFACAVILLLSPSLSRHAAMPRPLPADASTVGAYATTAAAIRAVVPPGARLFVLGNPVPGYLAGAQLYLQQASHPFTLVASSDHYSASRSGFWAEPQLEQWLSVDAGYALVEPPLVERLRTMTVYASLVGRLEELLARHFVRVAIVGGVSTVPEQVLYARVAVGSSGRAGPGPAPAGDQSLSSTARPNPSRP